MTMAFRPEVRFSLNFCGVDEEKSIPPGLKATVFRALGVRAEARTYPVATFSAAFLVVPHRGKVQASTAMGLTALAESAGRTNDGRMLAMEA